MAVDPRFPSALTPSNSTTLVPYTEVTSPVAMPRIVMGNWLQSSQSFPSAVCHTDFPGYGAEAAGPQTASGSPMPIRRRWTATVAALVMTLIILARPAGHAAAEVPSLNPNAGVATTALKYDGTYQGDCWGFVKRVVREATGRQMGFDYRQGFFDGGAIEVSLADAQAGDVIQFADASDTGPWADYAGLHTAIVLQRTSAGVFDVIDSNSQWDGIVRVRPGYDPISEATLKGLSFHIYRFPGGGTSTATTTIGQTVSTPAFSQQVPATIATPSDCLNLRETGDPSATVLACLPDGTQVALTGGQTESGGRTWASVVTPYGTGWVALEYVSVTTPASADEPAIQAEAA